MSWNDDVYIALGGNVGDVRATFRNVSERDLPALGAEVMARSSAYRTAALTWDPNEEQEDYWNAVIRVRTHLSAPELMRELIALEEEHGRTRERRWAPRTLDLDLLLYGETRLKSDLVELPHPRLQDRAFVLVPLAEIAPTLAIPGAGTIVDALDRLEQRAEGAILERDASFAQT